MPAEDRAGAADGGDPLADGTTLLEIADVIDLVCACVAAHPGASGARAAVADEPSLRQDLFALLDRPTQATWERVRDRTVVPSFLSRPGLPGPAGLTLADVCYAYGLPDVVCPSRRSLLALLRWGVAEYGAGRGH